MTAHLPSSYRAQPVDLAPVCESCEYRFRDHELAQVWVAGVAYRLCERCGPKLAQESSGGAA